MPKLEELNPGNLALRPSEVGVEATAGAARRIGMFSNQTAAAKEQTGHIFSAGIRAAGDAAVAIEDHREISTGAAKGVELFANLVDSKDQAIKSIDPNDPAYGQKVDAAMKQWREQTLEPALEQFQQGFNTERSQAWAEHFVDQTRSHMWRESTADVMSAAALGVKNSARTIVNEASNTAINNPSSVDSLLDLVGHSVGGLVDSSPMKGVAGAGVRTEVTERAREQIVKAGAVGAIAKSSDPEATAADWIKRYPKYINGQEAQYLATNARSQIRAREADAQRADARAKQEAKEVSDEVADAIRTNIDSNDPSLKNNPYAAQALNDPRLLPKDRANIINYVKRQAKPETDARVSHETTSGFYRELADPNADLDSIRQRVWDARGKDPGEKGSINQSDFDGLLKNIVGRKTPEGSALAQDRGEFFKKYDASIDGAMAMGEHSALGKQRMYQAEQDAIRREADLKRQGKDPHQIYNPSSPDFFGKPENLAKYAVSFQDAQKYDRDIGKASTAPEAPLRPIPARAADMLRNNPSMRDDFDAKYGKGQAAKILGK